MVTRLASTEKSLVIWWKDWGFKPGGGGSFSAKIHAGPETYLGFPAMRTKAFPELKRQGCGIDNTRHVQAT
jgi:hypothetical protein